jgi:hypothetical protein
MSAPAIKPVVNTEREKAVAALATSVRFALQKAEREHYARERLQDTGAADARLAVTVAARDTDRAIYLIADNVQAMIERELAHRGVSP